MLRALLDGHDAGVALLGLHPGLGPCVDDDGDADARTADPARAGAADGAGTGARDRRGLDQADVAGAGAEVV